MRRAQAALEFLMTYGWAFAVIMITLATLAYVGVFDLDLFIVERCEFSSNIYCIDGIARSDGVQLAVQNGQVITLENVSIIVPECDEDTIASGPPSLLAGEQGLYNISCSLEVGSLLKSNIELNYTNPDSGFDHIKIGRLVYRVNS